MELLGVALLGVNLVNPDKWGEPSALPTYYF
ncbi:MAG: hypothetical protein RLZZ579_928 [Actinomycetota bacterium]